MTPHTLRHAFGSLLLSWGEPLNYVSAQLGHGSASFTLQTYLHEIKERREWNKGRHAGKAGGRVPAT